MVPKLSREEAMHQIAVQITDKTPEMQALVMRCVELAYEAGYNACQMDIQQVSGLIGQVIGSQKVH